MTEKHHLLTNDEFEQKLSSCTLPAVIFTHEAHLRISYIYIKKYGLEKAIVKLSEQIANIDNRYGDGTKFNKTLTVASIKVLNHFIKKAKAIDFNGLVQEFPRLKTNFLGLIQKHYRLNLVHSELAKQEYLEPDLLAFA